MINKRFKVCLLFVSIIILTIITLDSVLLSTERKVVSRCMSDLDGDGLEEEIFLTATRGNQYGSDLIICSKDKVIGRHDLEVLKPWKVQVADVDGDGIKEISVGVYKTAKFHPVPAKRPFVYSQNKGKIWPKWLGSRLSRPFNDYVFSDVDIDGMDELISIEQLADGRMVLNSYKWKGFGFEGIGESREFEEITALKINIPEQEYVIYAEVKDKGHWREAAFSYIEGRLVEK